MYYLIQFILGVLLGFFAAKIANVVEEMCNTNSKDLIRGLKQKLWGSVFGLSCMIILSAALLSGQLNDMQGKKIERLCERVTAIEMTINEK